MHRQLIETTIEKYTQQTIDNLYVVSFENEFKEPNMIYIFSKNTPPKMDVETISIIKDYLICYFEKIVLHLVRIRLQQLPGGKRDQLEVIIDNLKCNNFTNIVGRYEFPFCGIVFSKYVPGRIIFLE